MSKRILVISPIPTHQQSAGNRVRVFSFVEILRKKGAEVFFALVGNISNFSRADLDELEDYWGPNVRIFDTEYIDISGGGLASFSRSVAGDDWPGAEVEDALQNFAREIQADMAVVTYIFLARLLECFDSSTVKIIDTLDIFTERNEKMAAHGITYEPAQSSLRLEHESAAISYSDVVLAIKEEDRGFFSSLTDSPVIHLGHNVQLGTPHLASVAAPIVFFGSCSQIGKRNVLHFIERILPEIQSDVPDVRLAIIGGVCDLLEELPENCITLGIRGDLAQLCTDARLVINSDVFATGLSIKSITALGFGKPLVSTPIGARGLEDGAHSAYLLADNDHAFAEAVTRIYRDDGLALRLSEQALTYARRNNRIVGSSVDQLLHVSSEIQQSR